ncbi:transposable element Tcb1 transposase [Trichonephila clavipes]|nr:transposable element Tcb1 transposase [Trichonephila clavipes]
MEDIAYTSRHRCISQRVLGYVTGAFKLQSHGLVRTVFTDESPRGCHRPPHVDNGRVTMMYRGAVLMYDCLPGYTLEGGASIYCDGRRWSAEPPTCTGLGIESRRMHGCLQMYRVFEVWEHSKYSSSLKSSRERSAFDQVSEFDRGGIVAYRDCGLSFREIGSSVGRNQATVLRICDHWRQEGTRDRRGRLHPCQCTPSCENRHIVRMAMTDRSVTSRTIAHHIESVTHHSVSTRTFRRHL